MHTSICHYPYINCYNAARWVLTTLLSTVPFDYQLQAKVMKRNARSFYSGTPIQRSPGGGLIYETDGDARRLA